MAQDPKDSPDRSKRGPRRVTREGIHAFVSRAEVVRWVHKHVAHAVPPRVADEVAQGALVEALEASAGPDDHADPQVRDKLLWGWLRTVVDRQVADHLEKAATRKEYEGEMPTAPVKRDEAGEPVNDPYDDAISDIDPSHDPRADGQRLEGLLLKQYLARAVSGNARDEQTLAWVLAWSYEDKSYEQIADDAGVTLSAVHSRVHEFKNRYLPRYKRYRERAVWALVLLLVAAVAIVVWWVLRARESEIRPADDFTWPAPSATESAAPPPVDSFNRALPPPGPPPPK